MAAIELYDSPLFDDANLQAYYRLEDVNDAKNSYHLTNANSVTFSAAMFNNGGNLGVANTNKTLYVPTNFGINGGAFSVVFWVKLLAEIGSGAWSLLFFNDTSSDVFYYIDYEYNSGTRRLALIRHKIGSTTDIAYYNITLGTSTIHHIALTFSGTVIKLYINGVEQISQSWTGNGTSESGASILIIGSNNQDGKFSSALFDDEAVFDDVLTATEIADLYDGTWPTTTTSTSSSSTSSSSTSTSTSSSSTSTSTSTSSSSSSSSTSSTSTTTPTPPTPPAFAEAYRYYSGEVVSVPLWGDVEVE